MGHEKRRVCAPPERKAAEHVKARLADFGVDAAQVEDESSDRALQRRVLVIAELAVRF